MFSNLVIEFAYPCGNHTDLGEEHAKAFKSVEPFTFNPVSVSGSYIVLGPDLYTDIYDLHAFPDQYDKLTYSSDSEAIDLREYPLVNYRLSDSSVLSAEDIPDDENCPLEELVEMLKIAYAATADPPVAAYSVTPETPDIGRPPFTAESLANDELTHMAWLTIFPPDLVDTYGRETLLSAPAWHVEELDDGAIMIVCHDDLSWQTSIYPVASHVGLPSYESHI